MRQFVRALAGMLAVLLSGAHAQSVFAESGSSATLSRLAGTPGPGLEALLPISVPSWVWITINGSLPWWGAWWPTWGWWWPAWAGWWWPWLGFFRPWWF